ncbi:MAG: hypothetical protein NTY37_07115, partial [Methanothrix sp.]|nr:hypothetical protein [Methanothrix sp.]
NPFGSGCADNHRDLMAWIVTVPPQNSILGISASLISSAMHFMQSLKFIANPFSVLHAVII